MSSESKKMSIHFKFFEEKLYYRKDINNTEFKEVPPLNKRSDLIWEAHLLGHFGINTTVYRLKEEYHWRKMNDSVEHIIGQCLPCQRNKKIKHLQHPSIALEVDSIFDRIGIDLVIGLPETKEGYKRICVITESLSKFVFIRPIKSKYAEEISDVLLEYISIFGPPKIILSDQGKEFNNA